MMVSIIGLRRRTYSRTMEPATLRASTALLWETSDTSMSLTRRMQSFTLEDRELKCNRVDDEVAGLSILRIQKIATTIKCWRESMKEH